MAEGEGFEPPLGLLLSLISSQVPSTTQPPFRSIAPNRCEDTGHYLLKGLLRKLMKQSRDSVSAHS